MRTLLILGGLAVCMLLVTPSNGYRTEYQYGGQKKSMDSGDLTVPAEPSEIPIMETTTKLPCCRWPRRPPCKKCTGGGSGTESVNDIPVDNEKKSMDSKDLTIPAGPIENLIMEITSKLPCCRWPIMGPCKVCTGGRGPIVRPRSHNITADDEKSMDSGDLTVPAEPIESLVMETTTQLPCCRWPLRKPCKHCTGMGSGTESVNNITTDDEKSMDSGDLTVPAEPSESLVMETTSKQCCEWPVIEDCKHCTGMGSGTESVNNITTDDEKSMDSGDLTVPAEASEIRIMETTTQLPCCRWPRRDPCQPCPGMGDPFVRPRSHNIPADDEKSMDSGDLTVPAEPRESLVMETTTQLPCCEWPEIEDCKDCHGMGPRTESVNNITTDDEKSMDSGDLTVPAEASEIRIMETTTQLPCCRWPRRDPCQPCPGMGDPFVRPRSHNIPADDEKSMDSGDLTVPAEPRESLVMETTTQLPCCEWPEIEDCKRCPITALIMPLPSNNITADDEKKSMDSGDLTVPAEPIENLIMEITSKLRCCQWPIMGPCKLCPRMDPISRLPSHDITTNDEKKSMDSGDLTVPAEPSEIPVMETTTKLPCCRWPRRDPCRRCTGGGGPNSRLPPDDIPAIYKKKSMDSGDLTVPAEPSERNVKPIRCCEWPIIEDCKLCPGMGDPITRLPSHDITADDEKKSMDSKDLTVPAEPIKNLIMETTSKRPCCQWPIMGPCKLCPRMDPISRLPSHDIPTEDEKNSMDSRDSTVPARPSESPIMEIPVGLQCCQWPLKPPCKLCPGMGTDIWNLVERSHHHR